MHKFDFETEEKQIGEEVLGTISKLANMQVALETEAQVLTTELQEVNRKLKRLSEETLPEAMLDVGLSSFTLSTGQNVTIKEDVYPSITSNNKAAAYLWLRQNGYGDIIKNEVKIAFGVGDDDKADMLRKLILSRKALKDLLPEQKESIHNSTLKSFIKGLKKEGVNIPDSITVYDGRRSIIK